MSAPLRRFLTDRPKRLAHGSHTPCATLKTEIVCHDLCCRRFLVAVAQEDLDDGLEVQPPFIDVLKKAPLGHCVYFDETTSGCQVHEKRPIDCRIYDCRDDGLRPLAYLGAPLNEVPFVSDAPRPCAECGRVLELSMGCAPACDGLAVCIACGAGYEVDFSYGERRFRIDFIPTSATTRLRFLMHSLMHRERFTEALPLGAQLLEGAPDDVGLLTAYGVLLGELGRRDEARELFGRLGTLDAQLELAWLDRLDGRLKDARARFDGVVGTLEGAPKIRAMVALGQLAVKQGDLSAAARWYVGALRESRDTGLRNDMLKERVLDLLHGSEEERRAVERLVLLG